MKHLFTIIFALFTLSAHAVEFGLGASIRADDASIYLPVQFGESFRLEAELRAFEGEAGSIISASTSASQSSVDSKLFGLGFFYTKSLSEKINLLAGVRAAYLATENESFSVSAFSSATNTSLRDADGYEIAPTLGLEYTITESVRLSLEAFWFDRSQDGEITTTSVSGGSFPITSTTTSDFDQDENGTDARVILRFFF